MTDTMAATLEAEVGQLLVGGYRTDTEGDALAELARRGQAGGVIFFSRNFDDLEGARAAVRRFRTLPLPEPLLLSVDQEGGRVARFPAPFPEFPPMREVGAWPDARIRAAGACIGRGLREMGIHLDFAPVVDVDSNPANPVIGDRAFSADPERVAAAAVAFIEGMQGEGVAACAKHFPGHGDTDLDSHLALPRLDHDRARLEAVELLPFARAAAAGVASVMTAHILFTALDDRYPATLSPAVLEPILRKAIGFEGLVISDDLEMRAISEHFGVEEAAVRAVGAGCDVLLICHQPEWLARAHRALVAAVGDGSLPRERVAEAAARVAAFKNRYVRPAPTPDWQRPVAERMPTWADGQA